MNNFFRITTTYYYLLLLTVSAARADSCTDLVSKELKRQNLGTFERPSVNKESRHESYAKFEREVESIPRGSDKINLRPDIKIKKLHDIEKKYRINESKDNLNRNDILYDKVVYFGKEGDAAEVYYDHNKMIGYTSKFSEQDELINLDSNCKINQITVLRKHNSYMYLNSDLCRDLPSAKNIAEGIPANSLNEFGLRCREQGGEATGVDGDSGGCKCKKDQKFINNPWTETCLSTRAIPAVTSLNKLDSFIRERGGLLSPASVENFSEALKYCEKYKEDLSPKSVKSTGSTKIGPAGR